MKLHRLKVAIVFTSFSVVPFPLALIITSMDVMGTFRFIMQHNEIVPAYFVLPPIAAFISSYIFGEKIRYDAKKKRNNLLPSMLYSMIIVFVALIIWGPSVYFVAQDHEKWFGVQMALLGTTFLSWAVYPPGLFAGYIVWRFTKSKNLKMDNETRGLVNQTVMCNKKE